MTDLDEKEPKISFQDDYKEALKQNERLQAQNELLKADKASLQSQISQWKRKSASLGEKEVKLTSVEPSEVPQIESKPSLSPSQNISHDHGPPPISFTNQPPVVIKTADPESIMHKFHPWEAGCVMCDPPIPNPQFKPEMKCDPKKGGCGGILGSFETALSMKHCPHCLKATEATPASDEGMRKAMDYLQKPRITV